MEVAAVSAWKSGQDLPCSLNEKAYVLLIYPTITMRYVTKCHPVTHVTHFTQTILKPKKSI